MKNLTPENWPVGAPDYWSLAGYEYQKLAARKALIAEVNTIPWLTDMAKSNEGDAGEKYLHIASRLADICNHPLKSVVKELYENTVLANSIKKDLNRAVFKSKYKGSLSEGFYNN